MMAETTHPERLTYSVKETAQVLGISKESAWARVWDRTSPSVRIGRRVLIPRRALEALLDGPTTPADAEGLRAGLRTEMEPR